MGQNESPGDRRFLSMFPFTRFHFGYLFLPHSQLLLLLLWGVGSAFVEAWPHRPVGFVGFSRWMACFLSGRWGNSGFSLFQVGLVLEGSSSIRFRGRGYVLPIFLWAGDKVGCSSSLRNPPPSHLATWRWPFFSEFEKGVACVFPWPLRK